MKIPWNDKYTRDTALIARIKEHCWRGLSLTEACALEGFYHAKRYAPLTLYALLRAGVPHLAVGPGQKQQRFFRDIDIEAYKRSLATAAVEAPPLPISAAPAAPAAAPDEMIALMQWARAKGVPSPSANRWAHAGHLGATWKTKNFGGTEQIILLSKSTADAWFEGHCAPKAPKPARTPAPQQTLTFDEPDTDMALE